MSLLWDEASFYLILMNPLIFHQSKALTIKMKERMKERKKEKVMLIWYHGWDKLYSIHNPCTKLSQYSQVIFMGLKFHSHAGFFQIYIPQQSITVNGGLDSDDSPLKFPVYIFYYTCRTCTLQLA